MKTQLNLRKGPKKEGFRIIKRFSCMKEAREYLKDYVKENNYQPSFDTDTFYDPENNTIIWISKQFTPTGIYTYPRNK